MYRICCSLNEFSFQKIRCSRRPIRPRARRLIEGATTWRRALPLSFLSEASSSEARLERDEKVFDFTYTDERTKRVFQNRTRRKTALFVRLFVANFKRYLLWIAHEVRASIRTKIARFSLAPGFETLSNSFQCLPKKAEFQRHHLRLLFMIG